jgi:WhiB family redox-sensing transcriptional regulator
MRPLSTRQIDKGEDWREQAACFGIPTREYDPWFATGKTASSEYDVARRVCADCPVRRLCLEDALRTEAEGPESDVHGVRGGLTPNERIDLRRGKKRPEMCGSKKGTDAGWQRHRRRAQDPCPECREAHSATAKGYPGSHDARVLELAATGMTQVAIARELRIARATVNRILMKKRAS